MTKEKDFFEEIEQEKPKDKKITKEMQENKLEKIRKDTNTVAISFKIIAWITLILGVIIGIITSTDIYGDFDFVNMLTMWLLYIAGFLVIFATGEVIQILHDIRAKLYRK